MPNIVILAHAKQRTQMDYTVPAPLTYRTMNDKSVLFSATDFVIIIMKTNNIMKAFTCSKINGLFLKY